MSGKGELRLGTMTFLELLAGAAWAGIVAADLFAGDAGAVAIGRTVGGTCGARVVELPLLLALELTLERVDRGGRSL